MSDLYLKFRYYVLLITAALFVGCSESTLESNAFKALRPVIKDPSSYELISIEAVDSLSEYDNISVAFDKGKHTFSMRRCKRSHCR